MKSKFFQLILTVFALSVFCNGQSNSWNGLTPLRSTRADVEKILGKPVKERSSSCYDYKSGEDFANICYVYFDCQDGWNVPKDTVLEISTSPERYLRKSFDELGLNETDYFLSVDDALHARWTNADKGISYDFENVKMFFGSKNYIPRSSDNENLRCNGFPPYDPEGQHYTMDTLLFYNSSLGKKEGLYSIFSRIDSFIIELKNNNAKDEYRGYILVYFDKKLSFQEYEKRLKKLKDHLYKRRKVSPKEIIVIEGGLRKESEVQFYRLPKELKPPAPTPTLPSPQFMRKQ